MASSPLAEPTPSPRRRVHFFILALILALAAVLRFFSLSALGFWTDELCALSAAQGHGLQLDRIPTDTLMPQIPTCTRLSNALPFWKIPDAMARDDAHPPLYFMLLRLWETFFGDSESAVRSLNVCFSLLAVLLLYIAATKSVGSSAALTACLLMTVATPQIQYAQEARNYMPVLVFALLAMIAIQRVQKTGCAGWCGIILLCFLAMMLTHYFAVGIAAGIGLIAVFNLRGRARAFSFNAMAAAALLFAVMWGPSLLRQQTVMHNGLSWLSDATPGHLQRRLFDLCRLPVRFFAEITDPHLQWLVAVCGAAFLISTVVLLFHRPELRPWIYTFLAPIALVAIADFARSTTQLNWVRYSLFATPAAYVLLAAGVRGRFQFFLPGIGVLLALCCLRTAYVPPWKTDFQTPIEKIDRLRHPDDGLIIIGPDPIADGILIAAYQHYARSMPPATAVLTKSPVGTVLQRFQKCPRVWIISLGHDQAIQNFEVDQEQPLSYADVILGRFVEPTGSH